MTWAQSAESYGQKLLSSQGWKPGQGLGARGSKHLNSPISALKVTYKDDNLGLGASLKSERSQTGLDAFQGLLGRLNSKDEAEVKKLEQKAEDRKLALWTQGRWGGVMFIPGGLLVQGDKFKTAEDEDTISNNPDEEPMKISVEEVAKKAAKALRKAQRQERREAKLNKRAERDITDSTYDTTSRTTELSTLERDKNKQSIDKSKANSSDILGANIANVLSTDEKSKGKDRLKKKYQRQSSAATCILKSAKQGIKITDAVQLPTPPSEVVEAPVPVPAIEPASRHVRHIIRGRNIQAKRMAFADAKMLDEVRCL